MCGRYGLSSPSRLVELPLDATLLADASAADPRWNITPSQSLHAVLADERGARASRVKWGLVPFWAKDPTIGTRLANARGESVRAKPSFRTPFASRRGLVLADLFYEWQKRDDSTGKQPWCVRMHDDAPFAFAALWDVWRDKEAADAGTELVTCTLITTSANALMREIHERMPVIIPRERYSTWLDISSPLDEVESLLVPHDASAMRAYPVSTWVNSPAHDDANCAEPDPLYCRPTDDALPTRPGGSL